MAKNQTAANSTKPEAKPFPGTPAAPKAPRKGGKKSVESPAAEQQLAPTAPTEHVITEEQRQADRRANDQLAANKAMEFSAQQLSAPQAPTAEELAAKKAAFEAELKALQEKHGVVAQVTVKPAKLAKVQSNNITRPGAESLCGKVWAAADEISKASHGIATIGALKEHPAMKGVNDHTIKTQYSKWRQFNGVKGRLPKLHAVHQEEGQYDAALPNTPAPAAE